MSKRTLFLILLSVYLVSMLVILPSGFPTGDQTHWWNTAFVYRKKITFNNAAIGENLVNFQMPIVFYPNNTGFWAHVNRTTGTDVRFVDADNATELYYEVEMFNVATNMTIYWVLVPQVNSGSTTDNIWVYYGNSHVGFDSYNSKTAVWSTSTYMAVWHLTETTGNYSDSTNNKNNVNTISGVTRTATGKFGATCPSFDGSNDYLSAAASTTLGAPADLLVEMWMRTTNYAQESGLISCNVVGNGWNIEMYPSKNVLFQFGEAVSPFSQTNDNRIAANNVWYHVAWRYVNSTNDVSFYVNGVQCTESGSLPATHWTPQLVPTYIGMAKPASTLLYPYPGLMSEVRLSNTPKSAYWIQASYQYEVNQAKFTFVSEDSWSASTEYPVPTNLTATIGLSTTVQTTYHVDTSVTTTLGLATDVQVQHGISIDVTGTITLTTIVQVEHGVPFNVTGTISLTTNVQVESGVPLEVTGTVSLTTDVQVEHNISLEVTGTVALTTDIQVEHGLAFNATGTVSLVTIVQVEHGLPFNVTGTVGLNTVVQVQHGVPFELTGTIGLTVDVQVFHGGVPYNVSSGLTGTIGLTTYVQVEHGISATVTGTVTLNTIVEIKSGVPLESTATITLETDVVLTHAGTHYEVSTNVTGTVTFGVTVRTSYHVITIETPTISVGSIDRSNFTRPLTLPIHPSLSLHISGGSTPPPDGHGSLPPSTSSNAFDVKVAKIVHLYSFRGVELDRTTEVTITMTNMASTSGDAIVEWRVTDEQGITAIEKSESVYISKGDSAFVVCGFDLEPGDYVFHAQVKSIGGYLLASPATASLAFSLGSVYTDLLLDNYVIILICAFVGAIIFQSKLRHFSIAKRGGRLKHRRKGRKRRKRAA